MADEKIKALSKEERFVCEMLWGGIPAEVLWVRNSKMFMEGVNRFDRGEWKSLFDYEISQLKKKKEEKQ